MQAAQIRTRHQSGHCAARAAARSAAGDVPEVFVPADVRRTGDEAFQARSSPRLLPNHPRVGSQGALGHSGLGRAGCGPCCATESAALGVIRNRARRWPLARPARGPLSRLASFGHNVTPRAAIPVLPFWGCWPGAALGHDPRGRPSQGPWTSVPVPSRNPAPAPRGCRRRPGPDPLESTPRQRHLIAVASEQVPGQSLSVEPGHVASVAEMWPGL